MALGCEEPAGGEVHTALHWKQQEHLSRSKDTNQAEPAQEGAKRDKASWQIQFVGLDLGWWVLCDSQAQ